MTVSQINKAIKHLNLEVVKGKGYQYFLDLRDKSQVGSSVMVCHLKHLTLTQWIEAAEEAWRESWELTCPSAVPTLEP